MNALNTINFTNRTTYKTWTAEWKAQHAKLIADIRAAKIEIKESNRSIEGGRNIGRVWAALSNLRNLQADIRESLTLRANAKIEAQRQYLAEKAVAA